MEKKAPSEKSTEEQVAKKLEETKLEGNFLL